MKHLVIGQLQKPAKSFWMKHLVTGQLQKPSKLHGPSMLLDKAKFVECSIISLALFSRLFIGHHLEVRFSLVSFWDPVG